jgi:murein tripeptide amidase MpaA
MPYMNVTEVESALVALASTYSSFCELITLPNQTIEGRTSHAIRLGTKPANSVDAYYLTGGVHAREWGSCEILVNVATDLCAAYSGGTGVGYGGKYFSAAEVRALIEQFNIIIFPDVNPDGRNFSQTSVGLWRKNRDAADSGGDPSKVGIDINRNQDFLWDFNTDFAPLAINAFLASSDPSVDTYHGHAAQSEPETKNIVYLHDTFTRIRWYVDVHSFSEDILYVWGDDELQVSDPSQNFKNPAFNGDRGLVGDNYSEYLPDADLSSLQTLAKAFTSSLAEVRGKLYVAKPGFSLYATSGTNDDYAYSRHFSDASKAKSLSFTVEWGTEFQPTWSEMENIIQDVSAGLIALGLEALGIDSYIVTNRDTFSSYEVATVLSYPLAFYAIYDGFSPNSLGIPGAAPSITFRDAIGGNVISSISAQASPPDLEDPGALDTPQRISFPFEIDFTDASAFTSETRQIYVQASLAGLTDVAPIELIEQPNPYMDDGPITWLSTDVRVFQLRPNGAVNMFSNVTLPDPNVDPNAPITYIQNFLTEVRGYGNAPALPFENIQQGESASQLELSRTVGGVRVFNFAVAKVRYRANTVDANDVRVFFRTFNTMVSDLSYTTDTSVDVQNYRRTSDGTIPLLGINTFFSGAGNQITSIPYFANNRVDSSTKSMTQQGDPWNTVTLTPAGSTESLQYFGCWLDFNQSDPQFPVSVPLGNDGPFSGRVPITQLVRGIHTCLVAEIRYQPGAVDPIANGATPASSDRLAQRNLSIVESDNPGDPSTHVVSHTLLIKPSVAAVQFEDRRIGGNSYDELVIRWNDIPPNTSASLYFPDWDADEILRLAESLRPGPRLLTKLEANAIGCAARGTTYIPIPIRAPNPIPGLLTLQLPLTVRDGQQFRVDVQQHSGLTVDQHVEGDGLSRKGVRQVNNYNFSARRVLGAFRMTVVVTVGEPLVEKVVRNLAVLRFIQQAIPATDSWSPVFARYIDQFSDKLSGLGIDPCLIGPSQDDPGVPGRLHKPKAEAFTGKVSKVFFDCFGDFAGFVLTSCETSRHFKTTEKGICELVLRACKDRLTLTVCVHGGHDERIGEIIVRCGHCQ